MDVGAVRRVSKRFEQWRRLEDDIRVLTESEGEPIGRVLPNEQQERLLKTAEANPEWEHVWCAAQLAANTSMRGVEVKHVRRKDFDADKRVVHIRASKNETSKRVIPLNEPAFEAVERMPKRADVLGHTDPEHYLWCASQHHKLDPTKPASKWDTAWRALRDAAGLPGLRFHDLRHTVVTRLLEAGEPDHVVESITGHLSRRMLEDYSHIRLKAKKGALDRLDEAAKQLRPHDLDRKRDWNLDLGLGRKKIFEVRRIHDDITFIDTFLTPEFCEKHKFFSFAYNDAHNTYEIASRQFQEIKQQLLTSLTNPHWKS